MLLPPWGENTAVFMMTASDKSSKKRWRLTVKLAVIYRKYSKKEYMPVIVLFNSTFA